MELNWQTQVWSCSSQPTHQIQDNVILPVYLPQSSQWHSVRLWTPRSGVTGTLPGNRCSALCFLDCFLLNRCSFNLFSVCVAEQETSVEGRLHGHLCAGGGRHGVRGQSGRQQGTLGFNYFYLYQNNTLCPLGLAVSQSCYTTAPLWFPLELICLKLIVLHVCPCLQAVLCRMEATGGADGQRRSVTLALSKEHNPTIYEERMRIQRAGGTVRYTTHIHTNTPAVQGSGLKEEELYIPGNVVSCFIRNKHIQLLSEKTKPVFTFQMLRLENFCYFYFPKWLKWLIDYENSWLISCWWTKLTFSCFCVCVLGTAGCWVSSRCLALSETGSTNAVESFPPPTWGGVSSQPMTGKNWTTDWNFGTILNGFLFFFPASAAELWCGY